MKNIFKINNMMFIARLLLAFVFIYASIDKIIDPQSFSDNIDNYHISPYQFNNLAALVVPWLELIIGVCLLINVFLAGASFISIGLLVFFIFIISQALFRGINIDCGCFDLNSSNLDDIELRLKMIRRILEDFVFLGLAIFINLNSRKNKHD